MTMNACQWGVVLGASLAAAWWDIRTTRIPNWLTLPVGRWWAALVGLVGGDIRRGRRNRGMVLLGSALYPPVSPRPGRSRRRQDDGRDRHVDRLAAGTRRVVLRLYRRRCSGDVQDSPSGGTSEDLSESCSVAVSVCDRFRRRKAGLEPASDGSAKHRRRHRRARSHFPMALRFFSVFVSLDWRCTYGT